MYEISNMTVFMIGMMTLILLSGIAWLIFQCILNHHNQPGIETKHYGSSDAAFKLSDTRRYGKHYF